MINFIYLFIFYFKKINVKNINLYSNNFKLINNEIKIKKLNNTNNTYSGYDERYKENKEINGDILNKLHTNFIIQSVLKQNDSINILNLLKSMKDNDYIFNLKAGNLFKDWNYDF